MSDGEKKKLGWIPEDWGIKRLDQLLIRIKKTVIVDSKTKYREIGIRSHCKGIFHKKEVEGWKIGNKRVFWVVPDCFIFNNVFAWEQAIDLTTHNEKGMIASHRFPMYKPFEKQIDLTFLRYFFSTPIGKHLLGLASPGGAGRNKTLGLDKFMKIQIPYPSYIEQRKIAEILSTWDEAIEKTEALIRAKKKLKRGLMQQLLTGKKRFGEFVKSTKFKKTKIGMVPEDWEVRKLEEIVTKIKLGGNYPNNEGNQGFPLIKMGNISRGKINFKKVEYLPKKIDLNKNDLLRENDLLFNTRNTLELVGKVAIWKKEKPVAYYNSNLLRITCNLQFISSNDYMNLVFNSYYGLSQLRSFAIGTTSVAAIYNRDLLKFKVLLPPLPEQQKIASVLSTIDKEISILQSQLSTLKQQKKGLMQQLLTGKRRVKVDK